MKLKRFFAVFTLAFCSITFIGCDKNDEAPDPEGNVTLNMMNEDNGKPYWALRIYSSIGRTTSRHRAVTLSTQGKTYGLGASFPLTLDNLSQESAVLQGHMYYVYAKNSLRNFPSGKQAIFRRVRSSTKPM